jgi:circadian clock protein KaiC
VVTRKVPSDASSGKTPTGIAGLDSVTGGGFPHGRITLIEGGPGAGKTVLALQSLVHAARNLDEPAIFVAFEESALRVRENAARFGWDLPALERKSVFFLNAKPSFDVVQSGSFDLGGLLAALDVKIAQMGTRRIAFDAIDVVLSLLDDAAAERRELYRLSDWIASKDLSTIITSKASLESQSQQRGEFLEFMVDCVVNLQHEVVAGVSQRSLRVLKYRGSAFHENAAPYVIGASGFDVSGVRTSDHERVPVTDERISTGVARLDAMLGGGVFRGAAILTTGAPGTAKTTLAGAFVEATCERGEPTLYVSYDSATDEVIRNLSSVGLRLRRFLSTPKRPGLLRMTYENALDGSAETQLMQIQALAREHKPRCLVIDPLSAFANFTDPVRAQGVAKRLLFWAKSQGITLYCTSLLADQSLSDEGSILHISTIADTWMHLSYVARNGERNRCLSIIKSRGTAHSNQVRELLLSGQGITLADAYTGTGEVLLGTLRWERERAEEAALNQNVQAEALRRATLVSQEAELVSQSVALQLKLDAKRLELQGVSTNERALRDVAASNQSVRRSRRGADG